MRVWKITDHRMPQSPCFDEETGRDCPSRTVEPNCHTTCDKYLEFKTKCEKIREDRIRTAEENRVLNEIEHRRIKLAAEGRMYRKKKGE